MLKIRKNKMKQKILELIQCQKQSESECQYLLEELSQIEESKLDYKELDTLKDSKVRLEVELEMRCLFLSDLENLV